MSEAGGDWTKAEIYVNADEIITSDTQWGRLTGNHMFIWLRASSNKAFSVLFDDVIVEELPENIGVNIYQSNNGSNPVYTVGGVGTAVTLPKEPTRKNYTFGGWYTDKNCTQKYNGGSYKSNALLLYAKWNMNDTVVVDFEDEYYKRVSLIFGIWTSLEDKLQIEYVPLYDSFHNLRGLSKTDLIDILKAVLDNPNIDLDDKKMLKNQLIVSAGAFHTNISSSDIPLEQNLIKPAVNFVMLRDKAKNTLEAAKTLEKSGLYVDCANRCYYAMMDALKSLLEFKGLLAQWKENQLKETETHKSLERAMNDLVSNGVLLADDAADFTFVLNERMKCDYSLYVFKQADALDCISRTKAFLNKVELLTV